MAKCTDCNVDLIEGLGLYSQGVYLVELAKEENIERTHKSGFGSSGMPAMRQSIVLLA